ncbi:hypothetical protein HanPI659440_Chr15g0593191 [Helianthus annuus]|nr:hypothetical protein HanPI659440_Chr15g0593191 [Helianthus annuus]
MILWLNVCANCSIRNKYQFNAYCGLSGPSSSCKDHRCSRGC